MKTIYINGIPVNVDYASSIERYFPTTDRRRYERDIEDVEYEDFIENNDENKD